MSIEEVRLPSSAAGSTAGSLSDVMSSAGALVKRFHEDAPKRSQTLIDAELAQNILILGSGMVSSGLVDYLGRKSHRQVSLPVKMMR